MAKKEKLVTYRTDILCRINNHGTVIPCGSIDSILDYETEKTIAIKGAPSHYKIIMIWLGKYFSYPRIEK